MDKLIRYIEKDIYRLSEMSNSNAVVSGLKVLMNHLVGLYRNLSKSDLYRRNKYMKQIKSILNNLVKVDKKICDEVGVLDSAASLMRNCEQIKNIKYLLESLKKEKYIKPYKRKFN